MVRMLRNFSELKMKNFEKFRKKIISGYSFSPDVASGCIGKNKYENFEEAKQVLLKMKKGKRKQTGQLVVYKCNFCFFFHIGNQKEMRNVSN
jgi:hypothetical protein